MTWLRRVAQRLASDLYRREKQNQGLVVASRWGLAETTDPWPLSEPGGSCAIDARHLGQLERALLAAMAQLSTHERRLLYLHYVQGLSADELARCLSCDRSSVYRRLNHIKAQVKRWSIARAREQTGIGDREELDGLFQTNHMGIYLDPIVWLDVQ